VLRVAVENLSLRASGRNFRGHLIL
jgi:hypothetical protein